MTTETTPGALGSNDQLGLAQERDAVLAQLDDRTNQTWSVKRRRWAALVRAQGAEIERLRDLLFARGAMEDAPCFACGYNGPGYFQPDKHPCAAKHHEGYGSEA